ncbi:MAG: hypothetical protein QXJ62_00740 [Nitrososphaeria archaeon]
MIMITAVLVIASIIILFMTGVFKTTKSGGDIELCKQAAARCQQARLTNPDDPCNFCDEACSSNGVDIFDSWGGEAITCCKKADPSIIYYKSKECLASLKIVSGPTKNVEGPYNGKYNVTFSWKTNRPTKYIINIYVGPTPGPNIKCWLQNNTLSLDHTYTCTTLLESGKYNLSITNFDEYKNSIYFKEEFSVP